MKLLPRPLQVATLLLMAAGASLTFTRAKEELQCAWREPGLSPEEEAARWTGTLKPLEKADLRLGIENDGDTLYLRLESRNPGISRSALFRGLIVDLEPKGGKPFSIGLIPACLDGVSPPTQPRAVPSP